MEGEDTVKGLGFNSCTPIGALNRWLQIDADIGITEALSQSQVRQIIGSGILEESQDRGSLDIIKFITFISGLDGKVRRSLFRVERNKSTLMDVCIKILGQIVGTQEEKMRSNTAHWETEGKTLFGVASFEEWKGGISLLIDKLNQDRPLVTSSSDSQLARLWSQLTSFNRFSLRNLFVNLFPGVSRAP
ncbi:hypothetical protein CPB86DRAFT_789026 [Serendipita vermifera]|nr:hypothetical protein CPB86DRAFT_789026 [Serendipita vermifera]